jgi:NodT family efflux transporter outer membrane factor (OMF) lipoprotein
MRSRRLLLTMTAATLALTACVQGPNYSRPTAPLSATFKEASGFSPAAPADALERGDWWTLFNDSTLNDLVSKVSVTNQTLIADEAAYRAARALVAETRASLFPVINAGGSGQRDTGGSSNPTRNSFAVNIGASWEVDLWGRIRREINAAKDNAQASKADLASATLSLQGEVATDYFGLRSSDAQVALDQMSIQSYQRALTIAQNRYNAGVGTRADVLQAQTEVASAEADLVNTQRQRATYEHAIATLIGQAPGDFTLTQAAWMQGVPDIPTSLPSTLLQRRPDIAGNERRMAAANEQIGIARTAYFPTLSLTGSGGYGASEIGQLFNASSSLWSVGATAADDIFDFGSRKAQVDIAKANYDQAVATYRQTVLTALQDVEDQLVATRILIQQYQYRLQASTAADQAEQIVLNQYQAGQVAYTDVITAQTLAYNARNDLVTAQVQRQTTAIALIQSLGGGWKDTQLSANPQAAPRQ